MDAYSDHYFSVFQQKVFVMTKIDAAIIMKNEQEQLPGCLESIRSLGDLIQDINIYDTGSTDKSISIANSYGAKVKEGYWDHDFARARNEAIQMCSSDWILVIDCDERVIANPKKLKRILRHASKHVLAINCILESRDSMGGIGSAHHVLRISRSKKTWYRGELHEQLVCDNMPPCELKVDQGILKFIHFGYESRDTVVSKMGRNLQSVNLAISRMTSNHVDQNLLLNEISKRIMIHCTIGDVTNAEKDVSTVLEANPHYAGTMFINALESLCFEHVKSGRAKRASELLDDIQARANPSTFHEYMQALLLQQADAHNAALAILRGIDKLEMSTRVKESNSLVIRARMDSARKLGLIEEANACALAWISQYEFDSSPVVQLMCSWPTSDLESLGIFLSALPIDKRTAISVLAKAVSHRTPVVDFLSSLDNLDSSTVA